MWKWLLFLSFSLVAQESMLVQADALAKKFNPEVAKTSPPLLSPQPQSCLQTASNWFAIDLEEIQAPAFDTLNEGELWDLLREIGVEGVYLKGLKERTKIGLNSRWGYDWKALALTLQKKGIALIGDSIGNSTGLGVDFGLALKNVGNYPGLYHLVDIEKKEWKFLPQGCGNVPWLSLQELSKRGYVPEQGSSFVKESNWNASGEVKCADGRVRRWIYLKENGNDPVIDWLNPTFAGARIASADILDSIYNLGEKIIRFDGRMDANAKETLSLWTRKLGSFSVLDGKGGLDELQSAPTDLMADTLTRPALLHALIAEDAEALRLMYRLFLSEAIETKRLVHVLQPFDAFTCEWSELLLHPRKKYEYYEEVLTGEALRMRLLKEDVARITGLATWPSYCAAALGLKGFEKGRDEIGRLHTLLAFFYAMQPGAFSFSVSDLLGTMKKQTLQLMQANEGTLYVSLPGQMRNEKSFAMQLRQIFAVRREYEIEGGQLIAVPETMQRGLLLLLFKLRSGMLQLLALNFSKIDAAQVLERGEFRMTSAIDLMSGLAEKKPLDSASYLLELPPLTGKVILFQPKYYD